MAPSKWTVKSLRKLLAELGGFDRRLSPNVVGELPPRKWIWPETSRTESASGVRRVNSILRDRSDKFRTNPK